MSQKIILYRGLPASGKTTEAKRFIGKNPDYVRINKDDLRKMLHNGKHSRGRENLILKARDDLILLAIHHNKSVIVDDTNLNPIHEARIRKLVEEFHVEVVVDDSFLDVPLAFCLERDADRSVADGRVGARVIMSMYNQYLRNRHVIKQDSELPECIICDLDGTLALLNGRNPYDASTCDQDEVNELVQNLLNCSTIRIYSSRPVGNEIVETIKIRPQLIFVSGRSSKYRDQTVRFLERADYPIDSVTLYMREEGDIRADWIVKEEIYNNNIANKFRVKFVVDDRPQVIRMWQSKGFFVFNVDQTGVDF